MSRPAEARDALASPLGPLSGSGSGSGGRASPRRWWVRAGILLLLLVIVVGLVIAKKRSSAAFGELRGVRLGMTVRDVRARFDTTGAGAGAWESYVGDDGLVLRWKPTTDARGGPLAARFEFHMGIVMAIRADLAPGDTAAIGPTFELSESTVVVREPTPAGPVHLTVIARSCPTHAKEAERFVRDHAR